MCCGCIFSGMHILEGIHEAVVWEDGSDMQTKSRETFRFAVTLLLIGICLFLSGCGMSSEEKARANELVYRHKDQFAAQAITQYGQNARVRRIKAEAETIYDALWFGSETKTTGNLSGVITADREEFRGVYFPDRNQIYSDKNYQNICKTIKNSFGLADSETLSVTVTSPAYRVYYLPDEITTFRDMLDEKYFMLVHIYTTMDLSDFTRDDFAKLYSCYEKYGEEESGSVVLIQLDDGSDLDALQKDVNSITFEYEDHHGKVYDSKAKTYVDAFEKYHIKASLYLDKTKFIYNE